MKKIGTLNSHLSRVIASMGHTDRLVVCDAGLPLPRSGEIIDLAVTENIPRFLEVLDVILAELEVEGIILAGEMENHSPDLHAELMDRLGSTDVRHVPHDEFKKMTRLAGNITFVRTGEATPYANVILSAGVTFG